ncbi:MAG TPA: DUF692 family protein [Nitrospira sp.]|nr:DUF692 family protein [Nitrospira sp.]
MFAVDGMEYTRMGSRSHKEFLCRAGRIPIHGLGLSVDIHSPDLPSLLRSLQARQVPPAYFEVFYTEPAALRVVREQIGQRFLAYHGEGLWITQPEMVGSWADRQELDDAITHLQILQSAWLNHECATKYLAGYSYGTYLPPLYTRAAAETVAENAWQIQTLLDERCALANGSTPLLLVEMPPLTYFVAGTLPIPVFFRLLTQRAPCGLVLDVGHLWTVFRYSGAYRTSSLEAFVRLFLDEFPLDRVVEIHVAGLAIHESHMDAASAQARSAYGGPLSAWTDAHAAPIPPVLFDMLDQILSHPRLTSLKGMALEVDMKSEELIVEEFSGFSQRYSNVFERVTVKKDLPSELEIHPTREEAVSPSEQQGLGVLYDRYARVVAGRAEPVGTEWDHGQACFDELDLYRFSYLPYEILHWGGKVSDMFPESCQGLMALHVPLAEFVPFWFREPRSLSGTYDFFLLKVERFVEFVREVAPTLEAIAEREAEGLRQGYRAANIPHGAVQVH